MNEQEREPSYDEETERAMAEARAIMEGRIHAKRYPSAQALFDELDDELDREEKKQGRP